jgi:hypothetical protein
MTRHDESSASHAQVTSPLHPLLSCLGGDIIVASTVSLSIAPVLTVIDQAIVQSAAGTHSYMQSIRTSVSNLLLRPTEYIRSPAFLWIWSTYIITYSTANMIKTVTEFQYSSTSHQIKGIRSDTEPTARTDDKSKYLVTDAKDTSGFSSSSSSSSAIAVLVGTGMVNCSVSLLKDRAYAKLFGGTNNVTGKFPAATYGAWICRDFTGIGASFVLPPIVARHTHDQYGYEYQTAQRHAQLVVPVLAQLVVGPLHFLGYDCYNYPTLRSRWDRIVALRTAFVPLVTARMIRVLPGYGIAGVYNTSLRQQWREYITSPQLPTPVLSTRNTSLYGSSIATSCQPHA